VPGAVGRQRGDKICIMLAAISLHAALALILSGETYFSLV